MVNSLEGDTIVDQGGVDTINAVLNQNLSSATVIDGVENLNIKWDAFTAPTIDVTKVKGATVTLSSDKVGYLGDATVNGAGANTIVAGAGIKNALSVNGATNAIVDAANAKTVSVTGTAEATDVVVVNAGAATTDITVGTSTVDGNDVETVTVVAGAATANLSVYEYNTATIDAAQAKTIVLGGDDSTDTATVKVNADATVTNGAGKLTLDIAAGKAVTLDDIGEDLSVTGSGDVVLKIGADALSGQKVLDNKADGTLTVEVTSAPTVVSGTPSVATLDLEDVAADVIKLTQAGQVDATLKSGANLTVSADLVTSATGSTFTVANSGKTDSATLTFTKGQTATSFVGIETVNLVAAAEQTTNADGIDLVFTALSASASTGATATVKLSGSNDVKVTSLDAKVLDASALAGTLTVTTASGATNVTVVGATGKNDVTFLANAATAAFVGQAADDRVNFNTLTATAAATAVTGAGNDTIIANINTLGATGSLAVEAGAGDDTVELVGDADLNATISLQFGEGSDTLKLTDTTDLSKANLTITGLETIRIVDTDTSAGTDNVILSAAQVTGQSFVVKGNGAASGTDTLTVVGTNAADAIDLSKIVATDSLSEGASLIVAASQGDDVITLGTAKETVEFAATLAANGKDTITGFTFGAANDVLDFSDFLGTTIDSTTGASTSLIGVDGTAGDVVMNGGASSAADANFAILYNATGTIADANVVGTATAAHGEIVMANDQKAVILVATSAAATSFNVYQVTAGSTAGTNDVVELVGVVSSANALSNFDASNVFAS